MFGIFPVMRRAIGLLRAFKRPPAVYRRFRRSYIYASRAGIGNAVRAPEKEYGVTWAIYEKALVYYPRHGKHALVLRYTMRDEKILQVETPLAVAPWMGKLFYHAPLRGPLIKQDFENGVMLGPVPDRIGRSHHVWVVDGKDWGEYMP